jgi:hypothetical protein
VNRATVRLLNSQDAATLDRLIYRFAEELAECSEECMFCLTEPGMGATARVVETETAETLARFIAFASPHLKIQTV